MNNFQSRGFFWDRVIRLAEEMEAIRSYGRLLKVKLREKEEHLAILQQKCQGCA